MLERMQQVGELAWGPTVFRSSGMLHVIVPESDADDLLVQASDGLGVVSGFVWEGSAEEHAVMPPRSEQEQRRQFFQALVNGNTWPLDEDWSGTYSAVAYSQKSNTLILCNDLIGHLPLYYSEMASGIAGGSHLIPLSRWLGAAPDPVGVLEHVTSPNCLYGRRTLFRGLLRPLPGERVLFDSNSGQIRHDFDNSLCGKTVSGTLPDVADLVWATLRSETRRLTETHRKVNVALSGGWDSRLVLGAVAGTNCQLRCLTYGRVDSYETKIARRCAESVGATHECYPFESHYFPARALFERWVARTEALMVPDWCPLIEAERSRRQGRELLLLGDHCESIDGRFMLQLSSREARRQSFFNSLAGLPDTVLSATEDRFKSWKLQKQTSILRALQQNFSRLAPALAQAADWPWIADAAVADLDLSFSRVEGNWPLFAPMFDELFSWFHKVRYWNAGQNVFLNGAFRATSPAMSVRSLRLISRVHPAMRIRRRLMDEIATKPEFDRLARIPSAQIPWLGARVPALLRELIWGMRSGADQLLIKRVIKTQDPCKRQRVLPSVDYIREYRRPETIPTVKSWFSGKWINGEPWIKQTESRANLTHWPLINADIATAANVSILLDLSSQNYPRMERML